MAHDKFQKNEIVFSNPGYGLHKLVMLAEDSSSNISTLLAHLEPEKNVGFVQSPLRVTQKSSGDVKLRFPSLSLWGFLGPLPHKFQEMIGNSKDHPESGLLELLAIFHKRLAPLLVQDYQQTSSIAGWEQSINTGTESIHSKILRSKSSGLSSFDGAIRRYYHDHCRVSQISPSNLKLILEDQFGFPIEISTLQGNWILAKNSYTLGQKDHRLKGGLPLGKNHNSAFKTAPKSITLGRRIFSCLERITIKIGPVEDSKFLIAIRDRSYIAKLRNLCLSLLGAPVKIDFHIEIPQSKSETTLGTKQSKRACLGMGARLKGTFKSNSTIKFIDQY